MPRAQATTDHQTIRHWIETHDGHPSVVRATQGRRKGSAGLLRVDFEPAEESLEEISWDDFFDTFDKNNLAFLYQEDSRFHKFVSRDSVEDLDDAGARRASGSRAESSGSDRTTRQASPAEQEEAEEIDEEDIEEDFEDDEWDEDER